VSEEATHSHEEKGLLKNHKKTKKSKLSFPKIKMKSQTNHKKKQEEVNAALASQEKPDLSKAEAEEDAPISNEEEEAVFSPEVVEDEEPNGETAENEIIALKEKITELEDRYVRSAAEFENFKKRAAQELKTRLKFAAQPLVQDLITGMDNLERAIEQAKNHKDEPLSELLLGIEMVQKQFYEALEKNHVERSVPVGEPFTPNLHEAMGILETDEVEPDHIAQVYQAGYQLHDRVIRPAMVQIAKKKN